MNATLRTLATATLCGIIATTAALAQKSTDPSSGGGGGGTKTTTPTTTLTVNLYGSYYGIGSGGSLPPTGLATLTYDATGTSRSLTVSVSNVNLPNGTIIHFEMVDNALTVPTAYYPIWSAQPAGNVYLIGGKASLSIDTANGDAVPLIGTVGSVNVHAVDNHGNDRGTIVTGGYNLVATRKGGRP